MRLRSLAFSDHTLIPDRYSADGGNSSPPLMWDGVPEETSELMLLVEDPDAPDGTFTHWVLTAIPPESGGTAENEIPEGAVAGRNDFGATGWGGPKPPVGDDPHRYFFRLFALDRPVEVPADADARQARAALEGHVLDTGNLVGLFGR